jgi:hypothetical protein
MQQEKVQNVPTILAPIPFLETIQSVDEKLFRNLICCCYPVELDPPVSSSSVQQ